VVIELHGAVGGFEPKLLVDQAEGGRVEGLLETHVTIPVQLEPGPGSRLDRHVGKRPQDMLFALGEQGERLLLGRAVDAVSRRLHDPTLQLGVGV